MQNNVTQNYSDNIQEPKHLHEPYELRQIDLSVLRAKKHIDSNGYFFAKINNPAFKLKIISPHTRTYEELKILLKYRLFQYYLRTRKIKYCKCGNLINSHKVYIDLCNTCLKGA